MGSQPWKLSLGIVRCTHIFSMLTLSHISISMRNTCIERMWVEVGSQFVRSWRAFFQRLERIHFLDVQNSEHLWLLHLIFLDDINDGCAHFCERWNAHKISREGKHKSANVCPVMGYLPLHLLKSSQLGTSSTWFGAARCSSFARRL